MLTVCDTMSWSSRASRSRSAATAWGDGRRPPPVVLGQRPGLLAEAQGQRPEDAGDQAAGQGTGQPDAHRVIGNRVEEVGEEEQCPGRDQRDDRRATGAVGRDRVQRHQDHREGVVQRDRTACQREQDDGREDLDRSLVAARQQSEPRDGERRGDQVGRRPRRGPWPVPGDQQLRGGQSGHECVIAPARAEPRRCTTGGGRAGRAHDPQSVGSAAGRQASRRPRSGDLVRGRSGPDSPLRG